MKLQPLRGTRDLLGDQILLFREIERRFSTLAHLYNFSEIETPICEPTQTFKRSLGDTTDIVNKEMYTFEDRGGDSITMRPEGTAPVARAIISNGLTRETPLKLFYRGPMFRYERPQKGRYRQFYQFGVECLGIEGSTADVEVLALAHQLLGDLGLSESVDLELNTIGDEESRNAYRESLVSYLTPFEKDLSEDSVRRLKENPLRILDSKNETDIKIIEEAPTFDDSLNTTSRQFFDGVCEKLNRLSIPFQKNPKLVRGLDYYNHTVWEFTTKELGSQNAVLSGGRYDSLVATMGGPQLPGVGWAAGTDRLALMLKTPSPALPSFGLIGADPEGEVEAFETLNQLRHAQIACQIFYSGNVGKQMKKAHRRGCHGVLLFGVDERTKKEVTFKDLKTGTQSSVPLNDISAFLQKYMETVS